MEILMKRTAPVWIALAVLTIGCSQLDGVFASSSSEDVNNLLTPEQISGLNLESIIIQPGDLPENYQYGSPTSAVPERFKDYPQAHYQISVEITNRGSWAGDTTIFLYSDANDIEAAVNPNGTAYDPSNALEGLGEKSSFLKFSIPYGTGGSTLDGVNALWNRCSAVVEIRIVTRNDDEIKDYALLLDKRIAPLVCNNGQASTSNGVEPTERIESSPMPTKEVKSNASCPYQADDDLDTISNLILAESTAVNTEDISIIKAIFAPNATLRFVPDGTEWHSPVARYLELFEIADFVNATHFGIYPTGKGITENKAWFTSGGSGKYIPNVGEPQDYYNTVGKENWVLEKNVNGCWVITEFSFY
jgi:hypothetical protein